MHPCGSEVEKEVEVEVRVQGESQTWRVETVQSRAEQVNLLH